MLLYNSRIQKSIFFENDYYIFVIIKNAIELNIGVFIFLTLIQILKSNRIMKIYYEIWYIKYLLTKDML